MSEAIGRSGTEHVAKSRARRLGRAIAVVALAAAVAVALWFWVFPVVLRFLPENF